MAAGHSADLDEDLEFDDDDDDADVVSASPSKSAAASSSSHAGDKKHHFVKELRCMLYGFGDDRVPYRETVELLDQLVVEYIRNMSVRALNIGKPGRVHLEDIWYLIRREPRKFTRVKELLQMNEELKRARKAFDEAKYHEAASGKLP